MQKKRKGFDRKKFRSAGSAEVALPEGDVVREGRLQDDPSLPLVMEPAVDEVDLAGWLEANPDELLDRLHRSGAILFRGFGIDSPARLEAAASSVCQRLFNENGEHPRDSVSGNVYTPVFYPPEKRLLWHNENSFNPQWPKKIFFACARPPGKGGETPLVDSREVYRRVDPDVRDRFERLGVLYVRNYGQGLGLDWPVVFQTQSRSEVEEICARGGFEAEWTDHGRLRTTCVRPGVIRHPDTGETSWFNQAQHWHLACIEPEVRESFLESFGEENVPRHCYFGDGSPIPDEEMLHILDIYQELEVSFPWQRGDVVLVDNILAAHGRNPFEGDRKILVAMGEMTRYDELADQPPRSA